MLKKFLFPFIAFFLISFTLCKSQNNKLDSLQHLLANNISDSLRYKTLNDLIYNLTMIGEAVKAENYLAEFENLGNKITVPNRYAKLLNFKGLINFYKGNYENALNNYKNSKEQFQKLKDKSGIASVNNNMAMLLIQKGDLNKALECMMEACEYYETVKDKKRVMVIYNNIGTLYSQINNTDKAIKYFNLSLQITFELNDKNLRSNIYNNMGNIDVLKSQFKDALDHYDMALNLCIELSNKRLLGIIYTNISNVYAIEKNYYKAMVYQQKSYDVRLANGNQEQIMNSLNQIGRLNIYLKNYNKSARALDEALRINKRINIRPELSLSYLYYSRLDSARGLFKSAYQWYKEYSNLVDSLKNENQSWELGRLETKYEYEKKAEGILLKEKEKDHENENNIMKKNLLIYFLATLFLFMSIIFLFAYKSKRNKQKLNETLQGMVEERTRELRTAKEKAEASERIKDDFLSQMSHEIRTPLNNVISLAGVLHNNIKDLNGEEIISVVRGINKSGERIIRTIEMLLNYSEVVNGTYIPKKEEVDLVKICNEIIKKIKPIVEEKGLVIELNNQIGKNKIEGDEYSIKQVIKNIIENAVVYTEKGKIDIILEDSEGKISFYCRDTGIGMSDEYKKKIFEPFSQEEMGYTRKYEGNGLGLALSKRYCDINNASIKCESKKGAGSQLIIRFS